MQDLFQWGAWANYLSYLLQLESLKVEFDCRYLVPSQPPHQSPHNPSTNHQPCGGHDLKNSLALPSPASPQQRPLVRFSIPTECCIETWAHYCCPRLENVYVGVFGGDTLVDWVRPR